MRRLVWFSCGAASAVAAKHAVMSGGGNVEVVYCDTSATEHVDNMRFLRDVARWIGAPIQIVKSTRYATIDEVFMGVRYMSGPQGARCTVEMKKMPREGYQRPQDIHIFGYTADEAARAARFEENNPSLQVEWLLIDEGITKEDCFAEINSAGIALPAMYGLGFEHNNCLGCVKSSSAGYWNRTRRLFPEVFERRCQQSRALGVRLVYTSRGIRIFLDELPHDLDAPDDDIDCGPACQQPSADLDEVEKKILDKLFHKGE